MTLFFINYWGLNDPLTTASTLPHLELLEEMSSIDKVVFFTIEREGDQLNKVVLERFSKVEFIPIFSKKVLFNTLTKVFDFEKIKSVLYKSYEKYRPSKVICRSSLSGYFGYALWKKLE